MAEIMKAVPKFLSLGNTVIKENDTLEDGIDLPFISCPVMLTHLSLRPTSGI